MCGIVGYIGQKQALPILIQGLRRLEYRGYDSAGVAVLSHQPKTSNSEFRTPNSIIRVRAVGKVDILAEKIRGLSVDSTIGIAHTRWATHGGVTEENAHPHISCDLKVVLIHNGIIENYRELKERLKKQHAFVTETDTEVLVHLIEEHYRNKHGTQETANNNVFRQAVQSALFHVRGTYGIVVMHADHPHTLITARMGSPIVVGLGEGEQFIASDPTPILSFTKKMVFLNDGEIAEMTRERMETFTLRDERVLKCVEEIEWDDAEAQKGGFSHFMLKEIFDQPTVFEDAIRGRYTLAEGTARLGGLNMTDEQMRSIRRIVLLACGTASYAGMVGKYAFEKLASIPTEVDVSSEFRYRDPIIDEQTLVFGISQSGETADTIAALREAKRKGGYVRGVVNAIGSTIARETDGGTYIHAGPEFAVASTKAYMNMIAILILYALQFGRLKHLTFLSGQRLLYALREIPRQMNAILKKNEEIKQVALKYRDYKNFLFLGRGINYPVALEGSHKLKEISYIHSEAYPGGEMKHGVNALLAPDFPVMAILTKNQLYDKIRSNIEQVRARHAPVILIATEGDEGARELANDVIYVPETTELLQPLLNTIPLQLFAYYIAVSLGRDVDRPRNLAKSVTVE